MTQTLWALSVAAGLLLGGHSLPSQQPSQDLERVRAAIVARYADTLPPGTDTARTIPELLRMLGDPNTRRLSARQFAAFVQETNGARHVGVGLAELLRIDYDISGKHILIIDPEPDSPAERAGLRPGDVIERIGDTPAGGMSLATAGDQLRGPEGSSITLLIGRAGHHFAVRLTRSRIPAHEGTVDSGAAAHEARSPTAQDAACIRIKGFTASTPDSLAVALERAIAQHPTRLIVDLRGNPGGDVTAARRVAGYFTGPVPIALSVQRNGIDTVRAVGAALVHLPIIVWVDHGTASAAELLASALHDAAGADVQGIRTIGKGLVHALMGPLSDSSYVIYTVGRLASLSGTEIRAHGISPRQPISAPQRECVFSKL